MATPHIKVYSQDASGMGYGSYAQIYAPGLKVNITHSLLQGDQMTFQTISKTVNNDLDIKRPIRFYTGDDTKLFDGVIVDINTELIGNDYTQLTGVASGWWQELKSMDLLHETVFDNKSPSYMFEELCQMANDFGIAKKATYKYDTAKIPDYSTFSTAYTTNSGAEFVFNNIYQGLQDIVSFLDVAETSSTYDFGLRIESLPAATGDSWALTESNVDTGIYIIPYILREDNTVKATYQKFKLEAGAEVVKDYRNICNTCLAVGDTHHSQTFRTAYILNNTAITSNDQQFNKTNQVLGNHYLAVTIDNTTGSDKIGWVVVTRVDGVTNPSETFPMTVPAGQCATRFTSDRTDDGLPGVGQFLRCVDFNGCSVDVREITNDSSPYNMTIAGRSVNEVGYAAKRVENVWISTQAQADYIAGKMVRLYHNPMYAADFNILNKYISFDNNLGKPIDIYSKFDDIELPYLLLSSNWEFVGELVTQNITAALHLTQWDDEDRFNFVVDSSSNSVISSSGSLVHAT